MRRTFLAVCLGNRKPKVWERLILSPKQCKSMAKTAICIRSVHWGRRYITKTLLVMKLTVIFSTVFILNASAKAISQNVSFYGERVPLKTVFSSVTKQTGFAFFYPKSVLQNFKPVSINTDNIPLEEFLTELFQSQSLAFEIKGKNILISPKPAVKINALAEEEEVPNSPIRGKVLDEDGKPLSGASITIKNSKTVAIADAEGTFNLEVKEGDVIVVSFVGYQSKEIKVTGAQIGAGVFSVTLTKVLSQLDEVQIIAYGQTSRRLQTATVSVVKSTDIEKQPVNDPLLALQGRVPGMIITPTNGNIGSKVNIEIRGKNSLNFSSEPLVIVDNVPIQNNELFISPLGGGSPFSYFNPNDIESINILKDADATAIYGSRGANGVILITTKKGKAGKTEIGITARLGFGKVARRLDMLNTEEYLAMRKEAYVNDGIDYTQGPLLNNYVDLLVYDQNRYTDWQDVMIGGTAQFHDYQANVSGGNNTVRYMVGGNFHRETTVYPGTNNNNKGNMHFSIGGNSGNNKFRIQFTGNYLFDLKNVGPSDYTSNIWFAPNAPALLHEDGTVNWAENPTNGSETWLAEGNPYIRDKKRSDIKTYNLTGGIDVSYELLKGLQLKATGGINRLTGKNTCISPSMLPPVNAGNLQYEEFTRSLDINNIINEGWSFEPQINYSTSTNRLSLNLLAGTTFQSNSNLIEGFNFYGYSSDALIGNAAAAANVGRKDNYQNKYKYSAVFGRVTVNWDQKYLLNINVRRDGSSRFGPGNQFGNFGSVAAGWIFTNEEKIKSALPFLSFGKLKATYGLTGNDGISDYAYLESYYVSHSTVLYQGGVSYTSNGVVNRNYHWETVKKLEFSLDAGMLKDRILLQVNYFRNRSTNQLLNYPVPALAGFGNLTVNLPAKIQNSGLELSITSTNINTRNFSWTSEFNFTRNRNKLIDYPGLDQSAFYLSQIGQPFFGYLDLYHLAGVNPTTGEYEFYDAEGKIVSDPSTSQPPYYGKNIRIFTYPKFYGGLTNTLTYKNLSIDFLLQFTKQMGKYPAFSTPFLNPPGNGRLNILQEVYDNRWKKPGDNAKYMKLSTTFDYLGMNINARESEASYTEATFIRVKNVSISYTMPPKWISKLKMQNCRIYVQAQNLFTISKYPGLDPETQSVTYLPPLRVIAMGLQLTL